VTTTSQASDSILTDAVHFRSTGIELRDFLIGAKRMVDEEI